MMVLEQNQENLRERVIESLCLVRGVSRQVVDSEIDANGGDLGIDSKEGEAICAIVEEALELGELVQAADLMPDELTSVASLTRLFEQRVNECSTQTGKGAT
jgi:hypothetical protein